MDKITIDSTAVNINNIDAVLECAVRNLLAEKYAKTAYVIRENLNVVAHADLRTTEEADALIEELLLVR
ncbi:MAG: hypothetical protein R3Y59_11120 [bacterium]